MNFVIFGGADPTLGYYIGRVRASPIHSFKNTWMMQKGLTDALMVLKHPASCGSSGLPAATDRVPPYGTDCGRYGTGLISAFAFDVLERLGGGLC